MKHAHLKALRGVVRIASGNGSGPPEGSTAHLDLLRAARAAIVFFGGSRAASRKPKAPRRSH